MVHLHRRTFNGSVDKIEFYAKKSNSFNDSCREVQRMKLYKAKSFKKHLLNLTKLFPFLFTIFQTCTCFPTWKTASQFGRVGE